MERQLLDMIQTSLTNAEQHYQDMKKFTDMFADLYRQAMNMVINKEPIVNPAEDKNAEFIRRLEELAKAEQEQEEIRDTAIEGGQL